MKPSTPKFSLTLLIFLCLCVLFVPQPKADNFFDFFSLPKVPESSEETSDEPIVKPEENSSEEPLEIFEEEKDSENNIPDVSQPTNPDPLSPFDETHVPPVPSYQQESEHLSEPIPGSQSEDTFEKKMVEIPPAPVKDRIDAGDFRDPFFYMRGNSIDSKNSLRPGTTIDGLRFNSYLDSKGFIENYYRDSNFKLEDVFGRILLDNNEGGCLICHRGIEQISTNHPFQCKKCHGGNPRAQTMKRAHKGMVSNPSDLENAPKYCGKCHEEQIEKMANSLMTTSRGIIETTRNAWGAPPLEQPQTQISKTPVKKKAQKSKKKILKEEKNEEDDLLSFPWVYQSQKHPVDDFLEKKCLRCHLQGPSPHRPGDYRSTGCAGCHMIYSNDGITLSRDRAIQKTQKDSLKKNRDRFSKKFAMNNLKNPRGYPIVHQFTVAIPSVQCEHCHNHNGVGNEYEGLFGLPPEHKPVQRITDKDTPVLYGREHEFLTPDIHREKGLHCIDCHSTDEIKANANAYPTQHDAIGIRCETCHGTNSKPPEGYKLVETDLESEELINKNQLNPNLKKKIKMGDTVMAGPNGSPLPHILYKKGEWTLYSKVTGNEHKIPVLKELKAMPLSHQVPKHMIQVECSACHARWSASEWGLHSIREDVVDLKKWKDWSFADPTLQFFQNEGTSNETSNSTEMINWRTAKSNPNEISGEWKPGIWWNLITESTWDKIILGKNQRNNYSILKPQYQYFITQPESSNPRLRAGVPITNKGSPGLVMTPHTPHTIRSKGRTCESCHESTIATGQGDSNLLMIEKGKYFLEELKTKNRVLPKFQIKQMIASDGIPLQTIYPEGKSRFLKLKEIKRLLTQKDKYKAYRFLDLRHQRFPRLLSRKTFPFDDLHKKNEKKFGEPYRKENLFYYDLNQNQIFSYKPKPSTDVFNQEDTKKLFEPKSNSSINPSLPSDNKQVPFYGNDPNLPNSNYYQNGE